MSRSTVFLARSIGPFTILFVLGVLIRGNAIIEATAADGPVLFSYAVISLAAGVASYTVSMNTAIGDDPPNTKGTQHDKVQ